MAQLVKNPSTNVGDRINPWVGKIPWRRKRKPTPVFLPGKPHGERSLECYSLWGHKGVGHNLATKHTRTWCPLVTFITVSMQSAGPMRGGVWMVLFTVVSPIPGKCVAQSSSSTWSRIHERITSLGSLACPALNASLSSACVTSFSSFIFNNYFIYFWQC